MKNINHIRLAMTFLFCFLTIMAFGQENELTNRVANKTLNDSQQNFFNKITNRETTKRHELIELNLDVLKSSSITITLFDGQTITINQEIKKTRGNGGYTWKGTSPDKRARLILVVNGNEAMGSIMLNNKAYRIESIGNGTYLLIEVDQSKFPPEDCNFNQDNKSQGNSTGSSNKSGFGASVLSHTPGCDLRLLVAYTPAADGQVANILNLIQLAVEETNDSYDNSNINHEVELAHVVAVNYVETNDIDTDKDRFANGNDGFMDEIHELRSLYSADVGVLIDPNGNWRTIMATFDQNIPRVQFWSNPNVNFPADNVPMGTAADNDNARVLNATTPQMLNYRVPSEDVTISNVTIPAMGFADLLAVNTIEATNFTVEAGAVVNLVAGNSITIGPESSVELGAEFSATIEQVTACCSDDIIPIRPDGTGITFEACSAGGSQLCIGFNCADDFTVSIFNNLAQLVHQASGTLDDNIACIWDGANTATGFYTAEITVSNGTESQTLTYTIQLISVNCKMGGTTSDITINEIPLDSIGPDKSTADVNKELTLLIYPNPANNRTIIEYTIPASDKITLILTNAFGREVRRLIDNQNVEQGNYIISFDATGLSPGIYHSTLKYGEQIKSKKVILIK